MGKDNLLLGTARGKLGDVVFYRTGGEQRFRTRVRPTNPRTNAQLLQRCVVSTVVKAYSQLVPVCDHAFQNYEGKLKNQERYMRLNIKNFRTMALAHIISWSPIRFNNIQWGYWVGKDSMNIPVNPLQISEGDLPVVEPSFQQVGSASYNRIVIGEFEQKWDEITYRQLVTQLGLEAGDQLTFVVQLVKSGTDPSITRTDFSRMILMPSDGNMDGKAFLKSYAGTALDNISNPNKENYGILLVGGDEQPQENGTYRIYIRTFHQPKENANVGAAGIITSRFQNNTWRRSTSYMRIPSDNNFEGYTLQEAMASYEKSDTSSLYLNQATTNVRNAGEQAIEALALEEEVEEPTTKRSKK